ncbi:MAG: alpha/beta hydrolase [Brevibacillus sp.]|jgi:pimeloyl-ACP methyl ester carboxylesterase|nr:alpha/beta hydrolase [Brevibacillus sp.]
MIANDGNSELFRHRFVDVDGVSIYVVDAGDEHKPAILFLHGWPQNWTEFEKVMLPLCEDYHVMAIDLPGIGKSSTPLKVNDKRTIAKYVRALIKEFHLLKPTLVGHDVGGQIVYAYLHAFPGELARAVIMNVAIPGIDPWQEVKKNPYIWHFAFHSIPDLPETLLVGHLPEYFTYFFDAIAAKPGSVSESAREKYVEAYSRLESLKTGLEWYRSFPQDEKDNTSVKEPVHTPVLYVRGDHEFVSIDTYLKGFREAGLLNVSGRVISNSGHWAPEEQPEEVVSALRDFMASSY